jgi:hypothetical protein
LMLLDLELALKQVLMAICSHHQASRQKVRCGP